MATKTTTQLLDDIDGGKADRTITFGLDGVSYEIDLSSRNANALERALSRYVAVARKQRGAIAGSGRSNSGRAPARSDLAEIRAWAAANGHTVSDRGRISADVMAAYDAAH